MPRRSYRSTSRGSSRRRTASRGKTRSRSRSRAKTPAWHWLLSGMTLGGLVVVFLNMNQAQPITQHLSHQEERPVEENYAFYRLLSQDAKSKSVNEAGVASPVSVSKTISMKKKSVAPDVTHLAKTSVDHLSLQVAAFSSDVQANALLERLGGLGIPALVREVSRADKVLYRVLVSPIASEREAIGFQDRLAELGFEAQFVW